MAEPRSEFPAWPSSGVSDPKLNMFFEWVRQYIESVDTTLAAHTLATGHGDVVIGSPSVGHYLRFDGSDWVNVAIATVASDLAGQIPLNDIADPDGNATFNMTTRTLKFLWTNPGGNPLELEASGAYTGALLHIHQHTGNPGATRLFEIEATDTDVVHALSIGALATTLVWCNRVTGDSNDRYILYSDGKIEWGPGNGAMDTNLYRSAANTLKTDDAFEALTVNGQTISASTIHGAFGDDDHTQYHTDARAATWLAARALEDIGDVDAYDSPASGEILMWDGDSWLHRTLAEASIAAASHTHNASQITAGTFGTGHFTFPDCLLNVIHDDNTSYTLRLENKFHGSAVGAAIRFKAENASGQEAHGDFGFIAQTGGTERGLFYWKNPYNTGVMSLDYLGVLRIDDLLEYTAGAGVTIEGVGLKDSHLQFPSWAAGTGIMQYALITPHVFGAGKGISGYNAVDISFDRLLGCDRGPATVSYSNVTGGANIWAGDWSNTAVVAGSSTGIITVDFDNFPGYTADAASGFIYTEGVFAIYYYTVEGGYHRQPDNIKIEYYQYYSGSDQWRTVYDSAVDNADNPLIVNSYLGNYVKRVRFTFTNTGGSDPCRIVAIKWFPARAASNTDMKPYFQNWSGQAQYFAVPSVSFRDTSWNEVAKINGATGAIMSAASIYSVGAAIYVDRTGDATTATMAIYRDAAQYAFFEFHTGTSNSLRWRTGVDNIAEGGANAGTNYAIWRYDDSGGYLAQAMLISRNTGNVSFAAGYIGLGADVNIYRSAADMLKTDDDFTIAGGDLYIGTDVHLWRSGVDTLKTDDDFTCNDLGLLGSTAGDIIYSQDGEAMNYLSIGGDNTVLRAAGVSPSFPSYGKITSDYTTGTFPAASHTLDSHTSVLSVTKIELLAEGTFIVGGASANEKRALTASDIPSLDASKITTGYFGIARGGTNATSFTSDYVVYFDGSKLASWVDKDTLATTGANTFTAKQIFQIASGATFEFREAASGVSFATITWSDTGETLTIAGWNASEDPRGSCYFDLDYGGGSINVNLSIDYVNAQVISSSTIHGNFSDDDHTQYHTDARALTWLGTRSTSDLSEGTNLYYTNARADARIALANLEDLADVDAYATPASGEILMWDGDSWLHQTLAEASISAVGHGHAFTDITGQIDPDQVVTSPSAGDLVYVQDSAAFARLAHPGANQVLRGTGGTPNWGTITSAYTTGTFPPDSHTLDSHSSTLTVTKITAGADDTFLVTRSSTVQWGTIAAADVPSLDTSKITTGFPWTVAEGGTGATSLTADAVLYVTGGVIASWTDKDNIALLAGANTWTALQVFQRTFGNPLIEFREAASGVAYVNFEWDDGNEILYIKGWDSGDNPRNSFILDFTGTATGTKIWHEENDGHNSGLDADTLDTYHASSFIQNPMTSELEIQRSGNAIAIELRENNLGAFPDGASYDSPELRFTAAYDSLAGVGSTRSEIYADLWLDNQSVSNGSVTRDSRFVIEVDGAVVAYFEDGQILDLPKDLQIGGHGYSDGNYDNGTTSGAKTISCANGNLQRVTMGGAHQLSFSNQKYGVYLLCIMQGGTAYTPTWSGVDWGDRGTPTSADFAVNEDTWFTFVWTGTEMHGFFGGMGYTY